MDGLAFSATGGAINFEDDWNFLEARPDPLSSIHPYPAKFIPELPRKLIATYRPIDGLALLDPFCGSGTALSEAQVAGVPSIGIDLNPIAVMMSRVKTSPVPNGAGRALSEVLESAQSDFTPSLPNIPRLDHWFKPQVQIAIARLAEAIKARAGDSADILRLALSSIIVRVSNSGKRYAIRSD